MVSIAHAVAIVRRGRPMPDVADGGEDLHWYHESELAETIRELIPRELHIAIEVLYHIRNDHPVPQMPRNAAFQVLCILCDCWSQFDCVIWSELMPVYGEALQRGLMPERKFKRWLQFEGVLSSDASAHCAALVRLAKYTSHEWRMKFGTINLYHDLSVADIIRLHASFPTLWVMPIKDEKGRRARSFEDILQLLEVMPSRVSLNDRNREWLWAVVIARHVFTFIVAVSGGHMRVQVPLLLCQQPTNNYFVYTEQHQLNTLRLMEYAERCKHAAFFRICSALPLELQERITQCLLPGRHNVPPYRWGAPPRRFVVSDDELAWLRTL